MNKLMDILSVIEAGTVLDCVAPLMPNDSTDDRLRFLKELEPHKDLLPPHVKKWLISNSNRNLDYIVGFYQYLKDNNLRTTDYITLMFDAAGDNLNEYSYEDIGKIGYRDREKVEEYKVLLGYKKFMRNNGISEDFDAKVCHIANSIISMGNNYDFFEAYESSIIKKMLELSNLTLIDDVVTLADLIKKDDGYYNLISYISDHVYISKVDKIANVKEPQRLLNELCKTKLAYKTVEKDLPNYWREIVECVVRDDYNIKNLIQFRKNISHLSKIQHSDWRGYYDVITKERFKDLIYKSMNYAMTNIVYKALRTRKYTFLENLIKSEVDLLKSCDFFNHKVFIEKYINLNEFTARDIEELYEIGGSFYEHELSNINHLTPKELITILKLNKVMNGAIKVYDKLTGSIDTKLLNLRQLANAGFDYAFWSNRVIEKVNEISLSRRIELMPYKVSTRTMLEVLELEEKYDSLVAQANSEVDLDFIIRNAETINTEGSLAEIMDDFIENDEDSKEFIEMMMKSGNEINDIDNLKDFCIKGNATMVVKFCNNMDRTRINNILRIAKAAIDGNMKDFKFFNIEKEINHSLNKDTLDTWISDISFSRNGYVTYETYTFEDTMNIGIFPTHTCMNYKDGMYKRCLLANFDSNKKIIYVKKGDSIVGRAIIRLTKHSANAKVKSREGRDTLSFYDIDNRVMDEVDENLCIFLERPYFSHISSKEECTVKGMLVNLVRDKAKMAGVDFLASHDYDCCDLEKTTTKVYITKTKNGEQYMDSFGGDKYASDEAQYLKVECFK